MVNRSDWTPTAPVLQRGVDSDFVALVQLVLNNRVTPSPSLEIDGDFGSLTDRAVRRFQQQVGLPVTGNVDGDTWKALLFDPQTRTIVLPDVRQGGPINSNPNAAISIIRGTGTFREIPPREIFMPIGHCWWAILLGFVGGHFAQYVYWRRTRDGSKPEMP
jgi:peptidoglycan hydrolase-like protein with peptidoglycan-binding domain